MRKEIPQQDKLTRNSLLGIVYAISAMITFCLAQLSLPLAGIFAIGFFPLGKTLWDNASQEQSATDKKPMRKPVKKDDKVIDISNPQRLMLNKFNNKKIPQKSKLNIPTVSSKKRAKKQ